MAFNSDRHHTVRHAALFAIGDLRNEWDAELVKNLLNTFEDSDVTSIRQAAMYALSTTRYTRPRTPRGGPGKILQRQKDCMTAALADEGEDLTVRRLAEWGLETTRRAQVRDDIEGFNDTFLWGLGELPITPAPGPSA